MANSLGEVFILKTTDRSKGIPLLISKFGLADYSGKTVALKANFNSADPFPASTHIDTLSVLVRSLKEAGASEITLAERSGMGDTEQVLNEMGVFDLSKELGFNTVVLDDVGQQDWLKVERKGTHWIRGFYLAKIFHDADKVVQTCCLKTHRFGGHFTLSLKNSVGLVAKKVPDGLYDYMWELHGSPNQRRMIAEINNNYNLDFVLMDGIKAFTTGGPDKGTLVEPNLLLASRDRVAIDAVGVAILKMYGAKGKVGEAEIFEQDQLKRAAELGLGVKSADEIRLISLNDESRVEAERIEKVLKTHVAKH
ncbi:MAG TPA: DUF362 domain-containing protein [Candidatus Acidoferrum sp.]|nr:DUF362 domain-containing protein [Candidatus Acidoferrum sp.]